MRQVDLFDSTLRDGAQAEGISFTVSDKIKIVKTLDDIGVTYIEAGNPGSNPKDIEFFEKVKGVDFKNSRLVAFGSTRRPFMKPEDDKNVRSLLSADTGAVAIFGKCWDFHVVEIIKTTLDENLKMIRDTVRFLKESGKEVIFDGEHFFDGFKRNEEYALKCIEAAFEAGADVVALCDTNGGGFPSEIFKVTEAVVKRFGSSIGIHAHNDGGMAVANAIAAVEAGASQVQGTFIGFGERCGNTNLCVVAPNLSKLGISSLSPENQSKITAAARYVAEVSNIALDDKTPYVGRGAFAHKGGMHVDGVSKDPKSFEHISPETVGNERRLLTSEVAGRSAILAHIREISPNVTKDSPEASLVMDEIKRLEHSGYQFEGAEGTISIIIRKTLGRYKPFFELVNFKIIGEHPPYDDGQSAFALIKIVVDGETEVTAAEGRGPVNALDKALRKALEVFYPEISSIHLIDYKVRVIDSTSATASVVRVIIESSDGLESWSTVGVSHDILEASWKALVDSIEFKLIKNLENKFKSYGLKV
ncbi:MAG: citramalate synthase [Clostridiales bacterium]|nr:citramalate synthase [Clostridiales bacterium]